MTRRIPRSMALLLLAGCACWVQGACAWRLLRILSNPDAAPDAPFAIRPATRTIADGDLAGDQILSIDGKPFGGYRQYIDAVFGKKPGDRLLLVLSEPGGRAVERWVTVPSRRRRVPGIDQIALPLLCLALGIFAVAVRPFDRNAWLLLPVLATLAGIWNPDCGVQGLLPVFLILFGIRFPEPAPWERKRWWMKYLALTPCALVPLVVAALGILWEFDISAASRYRTLLTALSVLQSGILILAIAVFSFFIAMKSRFAASADSRRRSRILLCGLPAAFAFPPVAPLLLTYVVMVDRAMDLRSLLRGGLRWTITRGGLWLLRAAALSFALYGVRVHWPPADFAWLGLVVLLARRRFAARLFDWLDSRFFRDSFEADRALEALSREPLPPETAAKRISSILRVQDLVILLREGDSFVPAYSTRPGEPMNLDAAGPVARALHAKDAALFVDFAKPASWLRELTAEELQALDHMRTELLLPFMARGRLRGILSLGGKLSGAPYSNGEIRRLRRVASQISLTDRDGRLSPQ